MNRQDQIETVAKAIRNAFGARVTNRPYVKPREWSDLPDQVREAFRKEARAAIAAYERVGPTAAGRRAGHTAST